MFFFVLHINTIQIHCVDLSVCLSARPAKDMGFRLEKVLLLSLSSRIHDCDTLCSLQKRKPH